MSCPIGVIAVIFEARPEAIIQIASLAIKSGNAILLKGGKEAIRSNEAIITVIREAIQCKGEGVTEETEATASVSATSSSLNAAASAGVGVPADIVQLVETRGQIAELLLQDKYVDVSIRVFCA